MARRPTDWVFSVRIAEQNSGASRFVLVIQSIGRVPQLERTLLCHFYSTDCATQELVMQSRLSHLAPRTRAA